MSQRFDDNTIRDEAILWRRILNNPIWVKKAEDGNVKPSSAAFLDNHTNEVSVNVASLTNQNAVLENYPEMGLVSIEAGLPRSLNHIVAITPEDLDDPSHRVICPPEEAGSKKRKSAARTMAEMSKWIIYPQDFRE
jgi:hypothetical protein